MLTFFVCRSMTADQQQKSIDDFNDSDQVFIFLISLKAGGVGLNLTRANHLFLSDPWWNPAIGLLHINNVALCDYNVSLCFLHATLCTIFPRSSCDKSFSSTYVFARRRLSLCIRATSIRPSASRRTNTTGMFHHCLTFQVLSEISHPTLFTTTGFYSSLGDKK